MFDKIFFRRDTKNFLDPSDFSQVGKKVKKKKFFLAGFCFSKKKKRFLARKSILQLQNAFFNFFMDLDFLGKRGYGGVV